MLSGSAEMAGASKGGDVGHRARESSGNGYNESFNGKLRDELLDREILYTLEEAKVLIENWRREYNTVRPHSSLGYSPPAPETLACAAGTGVE